LREYFDYDPDYPDDDRICAEVRNLQVSLIDEKPTLRNRLVMRSNHKYSLLAKCFTDFANLDGYATGTAGGENDAKVDPANLPQITVKTDNKQITLGKVPIVYACSPRMTQISS
jgi:hypothetical protein